MLKKNLILIFIILATAKVFADNNVIFEKKSQINWATFNSSDLLDLKKWRADNEFDKSEEIMKMLRQERNHKEIIGRILECVGVCKNDKGTEIWNVSYLSKIREQDEIQTIGDSYAWIFLMDGTLVRLSPHSSVTFNEINIGKKEIFIHARINNGNVLWLSRASGKYKTASMRETDAIFLPLSMYQANSVNTEDVLDEDNLYKIYENGENEKKYNRLNELVESNNEFTSRKANYAFLVFPNGTIWGQNITAEFIVLFGGNSYIKNRGLEEVVEQWDREKAKLFLRGYKNESEEDVSFDTWYKVSMDGREYTDYGDGEKLFGIGEIPTKRIPTIFIARELMLQKYSKNIFDVKLSLKEMRLIHGYWLWDGFGKNENLDLNKRVTFLKEYTRRVETTNIGVLRGLIDDLKLKDVDSVSTKYDSSFYSKAIYKYSIKNEINYWNMAKGDRKVLNSTKRYFWRLINER